ncbi:Bug family tripartite tricarboxylate transporter substrate binding protein [Bosea sp. NPDC003192]|uniref:Bug family tripartite tricarboxylate transporter substrate binding protein n=1 Tax=Bosea sp. NPDC003192 TaxID=3390551 RepID=UPI003CFEECF8
MMRFGLGIIACLLTLAGADAIAEDKFPSRPIKIVVPYAAGGLADTISRVLTERMARDLGGQFVIESRPGANGTVASAAVARAEPDGYTLLITVEGHATNPSFFDRLSYDAIKDFAPVGFIGKSPMLLAVHPSVPARSVQEYISLAKSEPNLLTYGSIGFGSASHLAGEVLRTGADISIRHIPFRGGAPALNDLIAGHIKSMFVSPIIGLQHFQSGALIPLAIAAPERSDLLPNVPTMAEAGFALDASYWFGLLAPAGTPAPVLSKLEGALSEALKDPGTRHRLTQMGAIVDYKDGKEFGRFIAAESEFWGKFVRTHNIKSQ